MNFLDKIKETTGLDRDVAISQGKYVLKSVRKFDAIDEENHTVRIVINDSSVDRDGEIVLPMAFKDTLEHYLESGVVLFAHNYHQPPIAKMVKHELDDEKFIAYDEFAADEYDFARTCWQLVKGGYLKAASVGFIPLEFEEPDKENKAPEQTGVTYTKCELLEHSILPIGSNRNALVKIYNATKGKMDKAVADMMQKLIEQPQIYKSCGHSVLYDVDGNIIEPCPICDATKVYTEIGKAEEQIIETISIPVEVEKDDVPPMEKPYENEHACRLKDPKQYKTCRSSTRKHDGKEYRVLYCQRKDDISKWEEQAYRYNKSIWTVGEAREHCKDKDGTFEPAKKSVEDPEDKGTVTFQDLPLASRDRIWDASEAKKRVQDWAGKDDISWDKYRKAFIWYDSSKPDNLGSYKLPIADIIGGSLKAVPKGIFAVAQVLQGARGGVDIPDLDKEKAKKHIAKYYKKLDEVAPWDRKDFEGIQQGAVEKDVFVISGRTEESEKHDHAFRLYKDANGVISGTTLFAEWERDDETDHVHLIVERDVTAEYEGHTHDINVFKGIEGEKTKAEYDTTNFFEILDRLNQRMEVE